MQFSAPFSAQPRRSERSQILNHTAPQSLYSHPTTSHPLLFHHIVSSWQIGPSLRPVRIAGTPNSSAMRAVLARGVSITARRTRASTTTLARAGARRLPTLRYAPARVAQREALVLGRREALGLGLRDICRSLLVLTWVRVSIKDFVHILPHVSTFAGFLPIFMFQI